MLADYLQRDADRSAGLDDTDEALHRLQADPHDPEPTVQARVQDILEYTVAQRARVSILTSRPNHSANSCCCLEHPE